MGGGKIVAEKLIDTADLSSLKLTVSRQTGVVSLWAQTRRSAFGQQLHSLLSGTRAVGPESIPASRTGFLEPFMCGRMPYSALTQRKGPGPASA